MFSVKRAKCKRVCACATFHVRKKHRTGQTETNENGATLQEMVEMRWKDGEMRLGWKRPGESDLEWNAGG